MSRKVVFNYNSDDQISSIEEYRPSGGSLIFDYAIYLEYPDTGSKNPNRSEEYNLTNTLYRVRYYTCDDKINPILNSGLWACDDCIDFEFLPFTTNNLSSMIGWDSTETILDGSVSATYVYNSDDYPTQVTYAYDNGEVLVQNYEFICGQ